MSLILIFGAMALAEPLVAPATPPPIAETAAPAAVPAQTLRLPALTPVRLRVVGEIRSKTHVNGDKVAIVLAEPLQLNATVSIPSGTPGVAEVIHSAKGGMGGKAGELLVAARSLDISPDLQIRCARSDSRPSAARITRALQRV